ncbi:Uma2 family endonuclease [Alkalihalobacillus deserti]|uniref:Uma2 family endonuclease n=1 Tax=Alkalihalobacillus deserti TaxID=2879466 RepID=UPI001D143EEA|nr:Uma2 family endonuclease [Alkalihalobacillus deserti]
MVAKRQQDIGKYSYADYLQWTEGEQIELMDGIPYAMTPAPSREHQRLVLELGRQFANFLKGHDCDVYVAPFDVRLTETVSPNDEDIKTVIQPDLSVICDQKKLDERGCLGAPDLIIEVISPSTAAHDYIRKYQLYEKYAVKEYWLVHPFDQIVTVFLLGEGGFGKPTYYDKERSVAVATLPGFTIEVDSLFDN